MTNFLTMIMCFFSILFNTITPVTNSSVQYTNVMDDLNKDPNFANDKDKLYPNAPYEYNLKVIQIALSELNELFIYTYSPSYNETGIHALSINIAIGKEATNYTNYKLQLISSSSVFAKLKVLNINLGTDNQKYINISSIYRNADTAFGDRPLTTEKSCRVAQSWHTYYYNNQLKYEMTELEVLTITDKHTGYLSYNKGIHLFYQNQCFGHFIAFNTDRRIDKVYDATVSYDISHCSKIPLGDEQIHDTKTGQVVTLSEKDTATVEPDGLFGRKYSWKRISKVSDFIAHEEAQKVQILDEVKQTLNKYTWVLRFLETDYHFVASNGYQEYYKVNNQTILRMMFETDGKIYNLGVVDNKHNQPGNPDNKPDTPLDLTKYWWQDIQSWLNLQGAEFIKMLKLILLILGILVFAKPLEWIFKALKGLLGGFFSLFKSKDDK